MNDHEQLVHQLTELDESDFATVLEKARRWRVAHRPPPPERPNAFDRDKLAVWYARGHMALEPYIREIVYLPENAPAGEIRLLEVNVRSSDPDDAPLEVLDFGVDRDLPGEHSLFVADITPAQWDCIRAGTLTLPDGWELAGHRVFDRKRRG